MITQPVLDGVKDRKSEKQPEWDETPDKPVGYEAAGGERTNQQDRLQPIPNMGPWAAGSVAAHIVGRFPNRACPRLRPVVDVVLIGPSTHLVQSSVSALRARAVGRMRASNVIPILYGHSRSIDQSNGPSVVKADEFVARFLELANPSHHGYRDQKVHYIYSVRHHIGIC